MSAEHGAKSRAARNSRQRHGVRQSSGAFSPEQKRLAEKHGTPAEFAVAVYQCIPSDISMDEAAAAIAKYNTEWNEAATTGGGSY